MRAKLKDYKDWIQEEAEEIVLNLFIEPFAREWDWEDIWTRHKDWAYIAAMRNYTDAYANSIDQAYEWHRVLKRKCQIRC